jgi:hypothetical protein
MDGNDKETPDVTELALKFLQDAGLSDVEEQTQYEEVVDESEVEQTSGHPAWQAILDAIPADYHDKVMPTLQEWDRGVSRRFQKIHDEYEPYKAFEEIDPDDIRQALQVYGALTEDPQTTWETIGRVYGLSPQQVSQAMSSEEEDLDLDALPQSIRDRLSRIDQHDALLAQMAEQMQQAQQAEEEAEEDAALEGLLSDLQEEYGEFDEDYVVGLIASGVDPEEAVERFQSFTSRYQPQQPQQSAPKVMSSGGGVPSSSPVNVNGLSNQDTQALVAELLRLSQDS